MGRRRGSRTADLAARAAAVALAHSGVPVARVAARFGVRPDTVRRWMARYRRGGGEGLRTRATVGRRPRVAEGDLLRAAEAAAGDRRVREGSEPRPSRREIADRVAERTSYHPDHAARRLRRALGPADRILPVERALKMPNRTSPKGVGRLSAAREREEFRTAIRTNDVATVRRLLGRDPSLATVPDPDGTAPLTLAVYARAEDAVRELRAHGAEPDVFQAAMLGEVDRLRAILRVHPEAVRAYSADGWTPLHLAAHFGRFDAARTLLDAGAPLDAVARNGIANEPLQAAIAGRSRKIAKLLLDAGANPDRPSHGGFTAAHLAAENGDLEVLEWLKAAGADLVKPAEGGKTPAEIAAESGKDEAVRWFGAQYGREGPERPHRAGSSTRRKA